MNTKKENIRLLIADDHPVFRTGLKTIFKPVKHIEVVGEAENGQALTELVSTVQPDVILTDIVMPVVDGIAATKALCSNNPGIRIIALSMFDQEKMITEMIEAGALGYILKTSSRDIMINAVETVFRHKPFFDDQITDALFKMVQPGAKHFSAISPESINMQEKTVIRLICEEYSSKEIAHKMGLSTRTVEGYRTRIMLKVGAKSTAGIITYAIRSGLVDV